MIASIRMFALAVFVILLSGCRSQDAILVAYPTDIAYELVRSTGIRSWKVMGSEEAAPIIAKVRQMYIDNDAWPEDVKRAEDRHAVNAIVFEAGGYYAAYWLYSEKFEGRMWYYFFGTCFKKNNFNDALFSGGGNYNLDYGE